MKVETMRNVRKPEAQETEVPAYREIAPAVSQEEYDDACDILRAASLNKGINQGHAHFISELLKRATIPTRVPLTGKKLITPRIALYARFTSTDEYKNPIGTHTRRVHKIRESADGREIEEALILNKGVLTEARNFDNFLKLDDDPKCYRY